MLTLGFSLTLKNSECCSAVCYSPPMILAYSVYSNWWLAFNDWLYTIAILLRTLLFSFFFEERESKWNTFALIYLDAHAFCINAIDKMLFLPQYIKFSFFFLFFFFLIKSVCQLCQAKLISSHSHGHVYRCQ